MTGWIKVGRIAWNLDRILAVWVPAIDEEGKDKEPELILDIAGEKEPRRFRGDKAIDFLFEFRKFTGIDLVPEWGT